MRLLRRHLYRRLNTLIANETRKYIEKRDEKKELYEKAYHRALYHIASY